MAAAGVGGESWGLGWLGIRLKGYHGGGVLIYLFMDATIDDGPEGGQYFLGIPSTHAALIIKKQIKGIIIVGINYPR